MDWENCPAVERKPGKISGAWAFTGTRVSVYALFENLASGAAIDDFVEWFPGVNKQQVCAVLEHEANALRKALAVEVTVRSGHAGSVAGRLPVHSLDTLAEKGWSEKDNGELLDVAEREGYGVLVTTDQSLPCQQNLMGGESQCRSALHSPRNSLGGSDEAEPR